MSSSGSSPPYYAEIDRANGIAGDYAIIDAGVREDSTAAAKLRKHGLVILGKTSLSEWAHVRSLNSSNGWNAQGGQTYGAYYPDQDPSGSSSGSAVSTDLGLGLAALGTEVCITLLGNDNTWTRL